MGYLIKQAGSDFIKFETLIKANDMQTLSSAPYGLTPTIKAGFVFVPVTVYIQVNGTTSYDSFNHLWIQQAGGNKVNSSFQCLGSNQLTPSAVSSFIVNIEHGVTPTNVFGNRVVDSRDFEISMDIDDSSGDGDGLVTMIGYYIPIF